MKFVHLTPQPYIARIRKNGIRFGGGRRGRGVYAVPLMLMEQLTFIQHDRPVETDQRSSSTLWQWLGGRRFWHRNLAAVVFEPSLDHWPAALYLEIPAAVGLDWLTHLNDDVVVVSEGNLDSVREEHCKGYCGDLKLSVQNADATGAVLHALQCAGFRPHDRFSESLEMVFPSPIDPSLIRRIIPLYRSNQKFKRDRHRREMLE